MEHAATGTQLGAAIEHDVASSVRGVAATLGIADGGGSEGISVPASATGNWFGTLPPRVQTLIIAALGLLALSYPFFLPGTPVVGVGSVVCLLALIAVVARTPRRRAVALLTAGITGAVALSTALLLTYASPGEDRIALANLASIVMPAFPIGFVAAWSIARRDRYGRSIGLLLAVPCTLAVQVALVSAPSDLAGRFGKPLALVAAWGIPTVLGCAVAWFVDLAARKVGGQKP